MNRIELLTYWVRIDRKNQQIIPPESEVEQETYFLHPKIHHSIPGMKWQDVTGQHQVSYIPGEHFVVLECQVNEDHLLALRRSPDCFILWSESLSISHRQRDEQMSQQEWELLQNWVRENGAVPVDVEQLLGSRNSKSIVSTHLKDYMRRSNKVVTPAIN